MSFQPCPICDSEPFVRKEMGYGFANCQGCGIVSVMKKSSDNRTLEDVWNENVVTIALALEHYGWRRTNTEADEGHIKPVTEER